MGMCRGFGPIGERRANDLGGHPVQTTAMFPDGKDRDSLKGLRAYLHDVGRVWQELRSEPDHYVEIGDRVLCTGRVYAWGVGRVIDAPAGWVLRLRRRVLADRVRRCRRDGPRTERRSGWLVIRLHPGTLGLPQD